MTLILVTVSACDLPRDQNGSLSRITDHTLRAGLVESERKEEDREAILRFAQSVNAEAMIVSGDTHDLMTALGEGALDVVVSLPKNTPFGHAGFSRPVPGSGPQDRVWAVRAGENALLVRINGFHAETAESP